MRIGILTQPLHKNYGGLLQNYALQQVLLKEGHDVTTLNHQYPYRIHFKEHLYRIIIWGLSYIIPTKYKRPEYRPTLLEIAEIRKNTNVFIQKYIRCTRQITTKAGYKKLFEENKYDVIVVGSDQCWRLAYNRFPTAMFLDFVESENHIKRISYAASFGSDKWEYSDGLTIRCADLAKKFDLITVREDSGISLCEKYLQVKAYHVIDPTMLLCKDDYLRLIKKEKEPLSAGTLFNYILDPSKETSEFISKIADRLSLTPFCVLPKKQAENRTKDDIKKHIEDCIYPPVTKWLRAFMDAEMIICDSFHGCVFSIIFNKPFWVIGNEKRGNARFDSLLKTFGLQERLISMADNIDIEMPIDWNKVNMILTEKRNFSKSLLINALK